MALQKMSFRNVPVALGRMVHPLRDHCLLVSVGVLGGALLMFSRRRAGTPKEGSGWGRWLARLFSRLRRDDPPRTTDVIERLRKLEREPRYPDPAGTLGV